MPIFANTGQGLGVAEQPVGLDWRRKALWRRFGLGMAVVGQTTIATYAMLRVLPYHGSDPLEICLAVVFSLLFLGISIGFWLGLYGWMLRLTGGDSCSLLRRYPRERLQGVLLAKTAIVMPIYHEPVLRTFAGIRAVYQSLAEIGLLEHFDFFILSDSRDPEYWLLEQEAWYRLCRELGADGRLFYRRRTVNLKHKSGNVADFLRRWGKNYRYFMVLDADSVMAGATIAQMVRLMEVEPKIGILQSCPTIMNGGSFYARTQQFANQLFGPIFATGLAALQLGEAAFWGHNALLRTEPFMHHCGLRRLSGSGLFNGAIMSHDFVEAAYMGRAGYEVWLEPELACSYEETPPTLIDDLVRDRRWARGNLQHLWLLFNEPNLRLAHRLAFVHGIMSYCASPLWLLFLIMTGMETARLIIRPINYFPEQYSPFPVWPEFHPELAVTLFTSTLVLLFLPKLMAVVDALVTGRSRGFGGLVPLLGSLVLEILVSMLLAPIRMLAHSRFVIEALFNVNLQWAGQNRSGETSWRATVVSQLPGTLLATVWLAYAYHLDIHFLLWSLPVTVPLLLAAPISVLLGRQSFGNLLREHGLLAVAEELQAMPLLAAIASCPELTLSHGRCSVFQEAIIDPETNGIHQALARNLGGGVRGELLDLLRRRCLEHGPESLTVREQAILARDRESLRWLHQAVWRVGKDSCWWPFLATSILR